MEINNNDFDQKLVAKIKDGKITPYPRWRFLLKSYVVSALGTLALIIGAVSISVMIFFWGDTGWEIREQTHKSFWEFLLLTLPYFWLLLLALFVWVLYYNIKHTKHGYRYPVWLIALASILASVVLGMAFSLFGLGERIDNVLGEQAPLYNTVINRQIDFWDNPDDGRLMGVVTATAVERDFNLVDPRGENWHVTADPRALAPNLLAVGQPVDLVGEVKTDHEFSAEIIRPLRTGRRWLQKPRRSNSPRANQAPCPSGVCQGPVTIEDNTSTEDLIKNIPAGNIQNEKIELESSGTPEGIRVEIKLPSIKESIKD